MLLRVIIAVVMMICPAIPDPTSVHTPEVASVVVPDVKGWELCFSITIAAPLLISIRLVRPFQACTPLGGGSFPPRTCFTSSSTPAFRMESNTILCRVVQIDYHRLLSWICLLDYGFSFRNVPASDKTGIDDDRKDNSDRESGIGAAGFGTRGHEELQCSAWDGYGVQYVCVGG